jgi:hypothetical protein
MSHARCFFRPHDWEARKARITELYSDLARQINGEDIPAGYRTEVLYVCRRCGKPKVKKLPGRWKLDEVAS